MKYEIDGIAVSVFLLMIIGLFIMIKENIKHRRKQKKNEFDKYKQIIYRIQKKYNLGLKNGYHKIETNDPNIDVMLFYSFYEIFDYKKYEFLYITYLFSTKELKLYPHKYICEESIDIKDEKQLKLYLDKYFSSDFVKRIIKLKEMSEGV